MRQTEPTPCSYRAPDDDFFCEKYGVWYPMRDCNFRVLHRTFDGCVDCFQGRLNLRGPRRARGTDVAAGSQNLIAFPGRPDAPTVVLPTLAPRKP